MKIMIIGANISGHALCKSISSSPLCSKIYFASGNAGTSEISQSNHTTEFFMTKFQNRGGGVSRNYRDP